MSDPQTGVKAAPWKASFTAAKENTLPGLALQALGLGIVLLYFFVPGVRAAMGRLGDIKARAGFAFSLVSTALAGGLLPFLFLKARPSSRASTPWSYLPFYVVYWALRGVEVDLLYRFQAFLFGEGKAPLTIVYKVLVDQFIYNPLWAAPSQLIAYRWMRAGYDFGCFKGFKLGQFYRGPVLTALISTWGVWIPMVSIIYCLPSNLQIPLFNIVLCFWVLILSSLTRG